MTKKNNGISVHTFQSILILFLIALMIVFQFVDFHVFENGKDTEMITNSILRFLGGIVFVIIIIGIGYKRLLQFKHVGASLLIIIPALIISINNFPIIAFFEGRAVLEEPSYRVYLFLIECLSIGFFEELIFRGIILVFLIKRLAHLKHGVLLSIVFSSIIFGVIHVFNLLSGASIFDTFLQMGYSFLVGMMWAVIYLRTKNIWLVMILHATFNFFGQVMFYLGTVDGRFDPYTIAITIVLGVIVAFHTIRLFKQIEDQPSFI